MFTGLIKNQARLRSCGDKVLQIEVIDGILEDLEIGESIAVNGVCLTLTKVENESVLSFELSPETFSKTLFAKLSKGDLLNLERALRVGDRFGGHWVQGHVDGSGRIQSLKKTGDFWNIKIKVPLDSLSYFVEKGSVCIDGISLTVNDLEGEDLISLMIVPHTYNHTHLHTKNEGDSVHLEYDILAKYILRQKKVLEKIA